jgi:hypothetical protein
MEGDETVLSDCVAGSMMMGKWDGSGLGLGAVSQD